jgi:hypothetical protein
MGLSVHWHNAEQTIICFKISGEWTWDDMHSGIDRCYQMMDAVQHTVATLFDVKEAAGLPPSALTNMRYLNRKRHENSGKVVIVGLSPLHRVILNTFAKLYGFSNPNGVQFVATLEAAEALLMTSQETN